MCSTPRFFHVVSSVLLLCLGCTAASAADAKEARFPEKEPSWGICGNFSRWGALQVDDELQRDRELGVSIVRMDLDWNVIEPQKGVFDWSKTDRAVAALRRNGLQSLAVLDKRVPRWEPNCDLLTHKDLFLRYVRACVERYGKDIRYWEILNEPDIFNGADRNGGLVSPETYIDILKASYELIKSIDPELTVVFGSASEKILEPALQAGAAQWCDAWNLHCYNRVDPELRVGSWLTKYKNLYKKHGAYDREIWITECGRPTSWRYPRSVVVHSVLDYLKITPRECGILTLVNPELGVAGEQMIFKAEDAGFFREVREIHTSKLSAALVKEFPVAMIYDESYPAKDFNKLVAYVRAGGTLLCMGGIPFYSDLYRENNVIKQRGGERPCAERHKKLHIGFNAWWTALGRELKIPKNFDRMETVWDDFPMLPSLDFARYDRGPHEDALFGQLRILTEDNLKPGDTFVPVLMAQWKNGQKYPVAGIYQLDSDLKGNIFVFLPHYMPFQFPHTEDDQARLIVRDALLLRGMGAGRFFPYRTHEAGSNDHPEAHYGLCTRDLRPKPAFHAYQTLIRMCPENSTRIQLKQHDGSIWSASWTRPDGTPVTAIWARVRTHRVNLVCNTKPTCVRDYLGRIVENASLQQFQIDSGVRYLEGVSAVSFQ